MPVYSIGTRRIGLRPAGGARSWTVGSPPATTYRAIVSIGESNSGGQGIVSELPLALRSSTSRVRILIPSTGLFADMHLGVNNNEDHAGLDASFHAWEAGLLPYLDANSQTEPVYLIQCGQGGSALANWASGTPERNKAVARIAAAQSQFTTLGITVTWEIWATLGINDFIAGSPISVAAYSSGMIDWLADVRSMIGVGTAARIRSPRFMSTIQSLYPAYCAAHEALSGSVTNMQIVEATDLATDDIYHWSSASQVTIGQRMAALS